LWVKLIFLLSLTACGSGGAEAPPTASKPPVFERCTTTGQPAVVDVTQSWSAYLESDDFQEERTVAATAPSYALPAVDATRWSATFFKHNQYACSRQGQQTFMLLNPPGASWSQPMDLFVYLHGGGIGAFDSSGIYHPQFLSQQDCRSMVDEEDPLRLLSRWSGDSCEAEWPPVVGLSSQIVADADMRILIVSKCDQDFYAGVGTPDINNAWNPENRVDGLLATLSAVTLVHKLGATNKQRATVLAGDSAGGVGVHYVARELKRLGYPVAGIVSDSAVMSDTYDQIYRDAPSTCAFFEQVANPADFRPRVCTNATSAQQTHLTIQSNSTPVFLTWSPADSTFCSVQGVNLLFRDTVKAISTLNPGGVSETRRVCVDGNCDAHSLIRWVPPSAKNTERCNASGCEPILKTIHTWIRARRGLSGSTKPPG
jgi:hypothetical protein